jgi:hypothetical protein
MVRSVTSLETGPGDLIFDFKEEEQEKMGLYRVSQK